MCPGLKTGRASWPALLGAFLDGSRSMHRVRAPPLEPTLVPKGQPCRWEQCHMQFTNKQWRAICTAEQLLPMSTRGDRRSRAGWFSLARPSVRLGRTDG